jgi:PPOX class probable F420-dependent enzyme
MLGINRCTFDLVAIADVPKKGAKLMATLSDAVRALFDGPNYAHIATVLPNGAPHSAPVWVGLEGNQIAFLTHPASRKARNIAHDPRVALSITKHDQPTAMAQVRGRVAERLEGEQEVGS